LGLADFPGPGRVHSAEKRSCRCGEAPVPGAEEPGGRCVILYFNDIFVRDNDSAGDHIDLFDGALCYNEHLRVNAGGRAGA